MENHHNQNQNLYRCAAIDLIEVWLHQDIKFGILGRGVLVYFRDYLGHFFYFLISGAFFYIRD